MHAREWGRWLGADNGTLSLRTIQVADEEVSDLAVDRMRLRAASLTLDIQAVGLATDEATPSGVKGSPLLAGELLVRRDRSNSRCPWQGGRLCAR